MFPRIPCLSPRSLSPRRPARLALGSLALAVLAACGGGGGGDSGTASPAPTAGSEASLCAAPRSGVDPLTGRAYPDRPGSVRNEQNWLAAWTRDTYLWTHEVDYGNPASFPRAVDYFNVLKTNAVTGTGHAKDRFHFTYDTAAWNALSQAGVDVGYGATWAVTSSRPPRDVAVAYTEPGSPAAALSPALARGARILQVDGVDVVNDDTPEGIGKINAGLVPQKLGESHQFVVRDLGAAANRTITLVASNVTSAPVQNVRTVAGGAVGYLLFNEHIATAEAPLIAAINQLKAAHVSDLVIDLRYNGGGLLDIANRLSYMVAGPAKTSGQPFDLFQFNDMKPGLNPVTLKPNLPVPFFTTSSTGAPLPTLNLSRVYLLTSAGTCSASEAIINGLRGVDVEVVQIGAATCGKPYGFYPTDNCGTTYFSIQLQDANAKGFADYADGFVPRNGPTAGIAAGAVLPGCLVASDDFAHALGDPAEARLAAALQYRANGSCPPLPVAAAAAPSAQGATDGEGRATQLAVPDGHVLKNPLLNNRVLGQ